MNTTQRIIKNTMSLFASGLISPIVATVVVVYLARVLGPQDFGTVNFAIALVTYFTLFTDMGLGFYGAREVARHKDQVRAYFGDMLCIRVILTAISFVILLVFVGVLNKSQDIKLIIVLFGIGLFPAAIISEWAYQGMERMEYIGLLRILTRIMYMVLVVCFVRRHDDLYLVPCFQVGSSIIVNSVFFGIFVRLYGAPKIDFNFTKYRTILKAALPMGISVILIQVIYNIDTVMLGFFKGEEDVGYYNAAYKLIFPFVLGIGAYFDAIYPVASNFYQTSFEKLRTLKEHTARFMVMLAMPCAIGGMIIAEPVIHLFFGEQYIQSVAVFRILICMVSVICVNTIFARGLWACNRQGVYLKIVIGQAATNIIMNAILIPRFGIVGAAISKLTAEVVGMAFYYREFSKVVHIRIFDYVSRPLFSAILMGIYLILVSQLNIAFSIVGGVTIFTGSLFLTKGITKNDILMLRKAMI